MSIFGQFSKPTDHSFRRVFSLGDEGDGGGQVLICISSMCFLLSSRSVTLDPAILPLTITQLHSTPLLITKIEKARDMIHLSVNSKEMESLGEILPFMAE